jgi:thiol-disulfide isomerase/thioredoxin
MKYLLLLLLACITGLVNARVPGHLCIISGQLTDVAATKTNSYISLYTATLYEEEKNTFLQSLISEKGIFRFSFYLPADKEIRLKYNSKDYFLILSPGDSGFIMLDPVTKSVNYSGDHAERNNQLQQLGRSMEEWLDKTTGAFSAPKGLKDDAYHDLRLEQLNTTRQQLSAYLAEKEITDAVLKEWAMAKLEYTAGFDLCIFPFLGKRNETLLDTDPYFQFVGQFESDNRDGSRFFSFKEYLKQLQTGLEIICNINKSYENSKPVQMEDLFAFYLPSLQRIKHPALRSKAITQLYANKLLSSTSAYYNGALKYIDSLYKYGDAAFLNSLPAIRMQAEAAAKTWQRCIDEFKASPQEKKELEELFATTKGKVVYMDFWFTNCAPCMRELPYYNNLIDKLAGKPVKFIFFGAYMEEKEWKDTREKLKLKGTHFLLSENQVAFFEKYFGLVSYPHHSILRKDQTIVKFAPGFSSGGNDEQIYNELYRLCF